MQVHACLHLRKRISISSVQITWSNLFSICREFQIVMAFMQIMTFSVLSDAPEPRTWETATTQNRQIHIHPKPIGTTSHQMKAIICNSKAQELNINSNLSFHYCNKF